MQGRFSNFFRPSYPAKVGKLTSARRRKLLLSYAPDWVLTLALAALFFSLDKVEGYRRVFSLEDTSLRHPYTLHERVPNLWLYIICGLVPLVALPLINFFTVRSWWDFHNSWLGLVLGLSLTGSITQFVKITVDIVARCMPPEGATDPVFGLTSWEICTQTENKILRDGFRSFPSGHSSMSFAGLGFLAFYLAGKLHLFDKRGHAGKAWISLAPFSAAALVAISRSMDYRHHWHDILVGSTLGVVVSFFAYRQYYPSLASELSHQPYSPRIKDPEDADVSPNGPGILPLHLGNASSSSGYKPTQAPGAPLNNRYNTTPSPPPASNIYNQPQQTTVSSGQANPFVHNAPHGSHTAYNPPNSGYELEGTVPRPGQGRLQDQWKQGDGVDGTVPRGDDDDTEEYAEPYGGYKRETRFQPPQQSSGLT
ncbi:hypothetical protein NMY22_g11488 [Coprinellus aureogranulatus]|nr:hypothetical protein NMY22_g11488 [Coprinellus aureogranulatus]